MMLEYDNVKFNVEKRKSTPIGKLSYIIVNL